ncbi:hypothetical protein [Ornithinibacillus halophilus]|uniref:Uncharacterized protein n=1 Tax=Ornithinibacillus halophilus TaxID=930117 RepID=A0A1M5I9G8_9BACI|nr:hypothetical protein [Ornithinibacillus halophilus]SHG24769.1 hypothetical protein SAMN05216225_102232 [Ornithinibacillus halophilus]
MYKKWFSLFCLLFLLSACINDEPAIIRKETTPPNPNNDPELIEEVNEEKVDEFIEFALEEEIVRINLNLVPILQQYLTAANHREEMVEAMQLQNIHQEDENSIYLLEFSCNTNRSKCSYLLLDQSKDNSGHLLTDLAELKNVQLSPDETKLFFHFNRLTLDSPLPVSKVVTIDLGTWERLPLNTTNDNRMVNNYKWPIISAEWLDNETLSFYIPDVLHADIEHLNDWLNTANSQTTNIILTTNKTN